MKYHVSTKHPVTGDAIKVVPTGKARATEQGRIEIETKVITPGANLETLWITKGDLIDLEF